MMIIDELVLHLPPGYEARADAIAHLIGRELGRAGEAHDRSIGRLVLPPVAVPAGAGDAQIAAGVAAAIRAGVSARRGGA